jgi:hypothetical protein
MANQTDLPYRTSFYDGDLSPAMFEMLAYAQRNYPDFPTSLDQIHAYDNSYIPPTLGSTVIIPSSIMIAITFIIVVCRLWTRWLRKHELGLDDWLMVVATVSMTLNFQAYANNTDCRNCIYCCRNIRSQVWMHWHALL